MRPLRPHARPPSLQSGDIRSRACFSCGNAGCDYGLLLILERLQPRPPSVSAAAKVLAKLVPGGKPFIAFAMSLRRSTNLIWSLYARTIAVASLGSLYVGGGSYGTNSSTSGCLLSWSAVVLLILSQTVSGVA